MEQITNFFNQKIESIVFQLVLGYVAVKIFSFFIRHFVRPGKNLKKYGSWAVVTGATDGIGLAIAEQLAKQGLNIVLVSRTQAKLDGAAEDIETKFKVKTKTLAIDFSQFTLENQQTIFRELKSLEVGVLINNVGASYNFPQYYHELETDYAKYLLNMNVNSTLTMIDAVLPGMLQRKKGAIVAIGSIAGNGPSPLLAAYTASKAYVDGLHRTLFYEYQGQGIHFQVQTPSLIATKLAKIKTSSLTVPSPKAYAKAAVKAIGYGPKVNPYWAHELQDNLLLSLPEWLSAKIISTMHVGLRKRALKKQQQQKPTGKEE